MKKLIPIILIILTLPSCATVTGAITGPFTGISDVHSQATDPGDNFLYRWVLMPVVSLVGSPLGLVCGPVRGFQADAAFVVNGNYDGGLEKGQRGVAFKEAVSFPLFYWTKRKEGVWEEEPRTPAGPQAK